MQILQGSHGPVTELTEQQSIEGAWDQLPKQADLTEWQLVCVLSDVQDLVQNLTMESLPCDSDRNVLQFSPPTGATEAKKPTTSMLNFKKNNSLKTGMPTKKKLK